MLVTDRWGSGLSSHGNLRLSFKLFHGRILFTHVQSHSALVPID